MRHKFPCDAALSRGPADAVALSRCIYQWRGLCQRLESAGWRIDRTQVDRDKPARIGSPKEEGRLTPPLFDAKATPSRFFCPPFVLQPISFARRTASPR